jgi:hypothetical protein
VPDLRRLRRCHRGDGHGGGFLSRSGWLNGSR